MRRIVFTTSTMLAVLITFLTNALAAELFSRSSQLTSQVISQVISFAIFAPQLNRSKTIWVYLPPAYNTGARFPVLYMQDGQDLFDTKLKTAPNPYIDETLNRQLQQGVDWYGSWQLDVRLDRLFAEPDGALSGLIVVGIGSDTGNRTAEYSPWFWYGAASPEGDRYLDFIVDTLKPHIDRRYATLSGRDHTGIAGSSMGGLLALYAGLRRPQVFSKVAALSPVLSTQVSGRRLAQFIRQRKITLPMRFYVDLGSRELSFGPLAPIHDALIDSGVPAQDLWFRQIAGGEHRIGHWRERLPLALRWLYR